MLYHAIGKIKQHDGSVYVVTDVGEAGCVVYGPYRVLGVGSYEVEFYAMPHEMSGEACCVVDVLRRGKSITAEKDFTANELLYRNGIITVRFEVVERDTFEFRLTSTGSSALTVRYQRPLRQIAAEPPDPKEGD